MWCCRWNVACCIENESRSGLAMIDGKMAAGERISKILGILKYFARRIFFHR